MTYTRRLPEPIRAQTLASLSPRITPSRVGIGMDDKIGNGDGLVMLNTSNQTGHTVTWVSTSYRL